MALSLTHANRMLEKLGFPPVRKATHFEQSIDAYGTKGRWVIDSAERQALRAYPTVEAAVAANLETHWDTFDGAVLTTKERQELAAIPSQVARSIHAH
jgi:hypothetical protein